MSSVWRPFLKNILYNIIKKISYGRVGRNFYNEKKPLQEGLFEKTKGAELRSTHTCPVDRRILYEGVFYPNDAKTVAFLRLNFLDDGFFSLFGGKLAIDGDNQIENDVDVIFPDGHAKIV